MIKINNIIICSLLISISFSCKTQNNTKKKSDDNNISITIIKDSIVCNNHYESVSYPFISNGISKSDTINKQIIAYIGNLWNIEPKNLEDLKEQQLNQLKRCCNYSGNCSIFDKGNTVIFKNNTIVTIAFKYATFRADEYLEYLSFNILEGIMLNTGIFLDKNNLIKKINSRLKHRRNLDEIVLDPPNGKFSIKNLSNFYVTNLKSESGIRFNYVFGYDSENLEPIITKKDLFFTFKELKPHLTEKFKKQIGF